MILKNIVLFHSMYLDKSFKAECAKLGINLNAGKEGRANRYESLLKQRHVQVSYGTLRLLLLHVCKHDVWVACVE
jgi:hypothetical protein